MIFFTKLKCNWCNLCINCVNMGVCDPQGSLLSADSQCFRYRILRENISLSNCRKKDQNGFSMLTHVLDFLVYVSKERFFSCCEDVYWVYYVVYSEDPQGHNFDNTIPKRIRLQDIDERKRLAECERRKNKK